MINLEFEPADHDASSSSNSNSNSSVSSTITIVASAVVAFYLILGCNFLPQLVGCRLQYILYQSMLAKHLLGFAILYFLVINVDNPNGDFSDSALFKKFGLACLVYAWFFVTTRTNFSIMVANIVMLLVAYILYLRSGFYSRHGDKTPEGDRRQAIQQSIAKSLIALNVVLSVVGFSLYALEKKREYGQTFSVSKFLKGTRQCRYFTPAEARKDLML